MSDPDGTVSETGGRRSPSTGMPRWVRVFGITVLALLLVMVAVMLLSGSQHGPARHTSADGLGDWSPGAAVASAGPGMANCPRLASRRS